MVELGSKRVLAPGKYRWARAIGWGIALTAAVLIAGTVVSGLAYAFGAVLTHTPSRDLMNDAPGWVHFVALALMALVVLTTYVGLVRVGEDRWPSELAPADAAREVPLGLAIGGAMMAVAVGIMWVAGGVTLHSTPITAILRALGLSIQSGVVEEVMFRLIILRMLWLAFGPWAALAISAFIFGALHLINPNASWFAAICIMIEAGIMLAGFYILTGRLWVSIGVHAGWNFTQGWVFGAAVSGTNMFSGGPLVLTANAGAPEILTGGGFGPEASIGGLIVGTAVGAYTLWLARKRGRFDAAERTTASAEVAAEV